MLSDIPKRTCNKLFKRSFKLKHQKKKPKTRLLRLGYLKSIVVGPTWSVITFANSLGAILLPLEPPGLIKFFLQLLFYGIKSTSIGSSTKRS